jgi:hypothetical protein
MGEARGPRPCASRDGACNAQAADFTCYVSYGYPAGMSVGQVNPVVIPPVPM